MNLNFAITHHLFSGYVSAATDLKLAGHSIIIRKENTAGLDDFEVVKSVVYDFYYQGFIF